MNIGEIIAELRMDKNMNQEDLAAVLNLSLIHILYVKLIFLSK